MKLLIIPLIFAFSGCDVFNSQSDDDEPEQEEEPNFPDDFISFTVNDKEKKQHSEAMISPDRCHRVNIRYDWHEDPQPGYREAFRMYILFDKEKDSYSLKRIRSEELEEQGKLDDRKGCNTHFTLGAFFSEADYDAGVGRYYPDAEASNIDTLQITEFDPDAGPHGRIQGEFETTLYFESGYDPLRRYPDTLKIREGTFDIHLQHRDEM